VEVGTCAVLPLGMLPAAVLVTPGTTDDVVCSGRQAVIATGRATYWLAATAIVRELAVVVRGRVWTGSALTSGLLLRRLHGRQAPGSLRSTTSSR